MQQSLAVVIFIFFRMPFICHAAYQLLGHIQFLGAELEVARDLKRGRLNQFFGKMHQFENQGATSARLRDLTAQAKALVAEVEAAAP